MGSSSFLNAFRLIKRKPVLLLLLLPLQLAVPLIGRVVPLNLPADVGNVSSTTQMMNSMMGFYGDIFGMMGILLLLYVLAGVFLIPPAMELLHEGAQGAEAPSGWYGRGLVKHWWKPVAIGAIEVAITAIVSILFYIVLAIIVFAAVPQLGSLTGMQGLSESDLYTMASSLVVPVLVLMAVFMLVYHLLLSFFAMLMAATADRSFGDAFRALFSGFGFKKVMKVYGVYLLAQIVSGLVLAAFAAAYILLSGHISSREGFQTSLASFLGSWTYYFAIALASFTILFKSGYIFSVFQEIKNREAPASAPALPAGGPAQEGEQS
jgi:hypothetical protein